MRALVMGLIASYGFGEAAKAATAEPAQPSSRAAGVNGQLMVRSDRRSRVGERSHVASSSAVAAGAQLRHPGPVEALQPFLMEHAERFWHELRCAHACVSSMPRCVGSSTSGNPALATLIIPGPWYHHIYAHLPSARLIIGMLAAGFINKCCKCVTCGYCSAGASPALLTPWPVMTAWCSTPGLGT